MYTGYLLPELEKQKLLAMFPPKFPDVVAHHVTYQFGANSVLPPMANTYVSGYACDDAGIEALIVSVDGTRLRDDGKIYHITWSLDRSAGFKPVDSNKLISDHGWEAIPRVNVTMTPMIFK